MGEALALFEVPTVEFHGTSVGLGRHIGAGEPFCRRCQAFVDELAASGFVAPLDEHGRPVRPDPVSAPLPTPEPAVQRVGRQITAELVVTSRARDAVDDAVVDWLRGMLRKHPDLDLDGYENDHGLVTVTATIYDDPVPDAGRRRRDGDR